MNAKKRGLGKGLGALISDTEVVEEILKGTESDEIRQIDIELIERNENQPRSEFDNKTLEGLAKSIEEIGVIQPIVIKPQGDKYMIIAGERRYRASKLAGLKKIPAIIKNIEEIDADKIALIENIQREDLNPLDEAISYKNLMEKYELTQEEMAKGVGKSRSYIANTVRLLNLDERVMEFLREGRLTVGHCKLLLSIKDKDKQYEKAKKIIDQGETIRETTILFKRPVEPTRDIFVEALEEDLMSILGTRVSVLNSGKKRKIEIEYYTDEDLDRILEIITK